MVSSTDEKASTLNDAPPLAVLARLPRVGESSPPATEPPVLVIVDDLAEEVAEDVAAGVAGNETETLVESNLDESASAEPSIEEHEAQASPTDAVAALASVARPSVAAQAAAELSTDAKHASSTQPDLSRRRQPLPPAGRLAGRIFHLHQWISPHSSVVVTIALVAVAGLLYIVASQPAIDPGAYDQTWAGIEVDAAGDSSTATASDGVHAVGATTSPVAPVEQMAASPPAAPSMVGPALTGTPASSQAANREPAIGSVVRAEAVESDAPTNRDDPSLPGEVLQRKAGEPKLAPASPYPSTGMKFDTALLRQSTTTR